MQKTCEYTICAYSNEYNRIKLLEYDANFGQVYPGDGKGNFTYLAQSVAGLSI